MRSVFGAGKTQYQQLWIDLQAANRQKDTQKGDTEYTFPFPINNKCVNTEQASLAIEKSLQ